MVYNQKYLKGWANTSSFGLDFYMFLEKSAALLNVFTEKLLKLLSVQNVVFDDEQNSKKHWW